MTEKRSEDQTISDRYLADRLNDTEREMVETRIVHDAEFRRELELTEALRDGLRQLQAEGHVEPLLRSPPSMWQRFPLAIAAATLVCAIGVATLLVVRPVDDARQAMATEVLRFMKTRSSDARPDFVWQQSSRPVRIEMRFDVGLEPAAEYQVIVDRVSNGVTAPIHEVPAAQTDEGEVSITVESALLAPGDYRIRLVPRSSGSLPGEMNYTLRVAD